MTLYFETPVKFSDINVISTNEIWHPTAPLLAVASYSQDRGGFVTIFSDLGEPLKDVVYPKHSVSQVTALAWHPERNILVTGWENGEIKVWNGLDKEFTNITGPHKSPATLIQFSEKGGRLVTCDSGGSLVGWKLDSKGQTMTVFHLDLKESITHLTFHMTSQNNLEYDIEGLAKAAVNGDEHALDMFSDWRPKTTARKFKVQDGSDNLCFFVGTHAGSIYYINEVGVCREVLNTEGVPLNYILYHPTKNNLIVMMEGLTIGHFLVNSQGQLTELTKVKLSGRGQAIRGAASQGLVWANNNCLAVLTGDLVVRVWDIESNDNYILPTTLKNTPKEDAINQVSEIFSCIAYCQINQTLCAGTNAGHVYFWVKKSNYEDFLDNSEGSWELHNISNVTGTIKQLNWGSVNLRVPLLCVNCVSKVYIMKEQTLCTCFSENIWGVQRMATQILLEAANVSTLVNTDMQITDMCVNDGHFVVTNGRTIAFYEIVWKNNSENVNYEINFNSNKKEEKKVININFKSSFGCTNEGIIIHEKNIISLALTGVSINSSNGALISSIPTVSTEGEPIGMDVTGNYLTIFTMDGFLKIYDLSALEPKLITPVRNFYDMCSDFGEIIQAKTNSSGSKVALTLAAANLIPDGKLYVWDIEQDNLVFYDFRGSEDEDLENDLDNLDETQLLFNKICRNRIPLSVHWDTTDPRLLVCNAKKLRASNGKTKKGYVSLYGKSQHENQSSVKQNLEDEDHLVITMFVSSELGIRIKDVRSVDTDSKLLAVVTPFIAILSKLNIVRLVMADFDGLETCDKPTKEAILDFSYHLSLGNLDAAFKAIKLIQTPGVWSSLARMCVKTRRLDVAGVCLGHMGNARAARALRLAVADSTLPQEAKLAVLAIELNMLDEAEQLYVQCERYDLLNKLYQNRNKMEDAIKIAETKDRIHLRNTQHVWGQIYEQAGDFKDAIAHYEKANTHIYEVPRMLIDQPGQLEAYMSKTNDLELLTWWGQYIESQGDMNGALRVYTKAGDVYNQVRTLCFMGEEARAAELTRLSTDKTAFYHMARHYETSNNMEEAVKFFIKANAYSNAVRLCKENHMADDLWNIGLVAGYREKLECAKYFEEVGSVDKAIMLYHRAGLLHKALDLAFKSEQFDVLQDIAMTLDAASDPALIQKCADYFVANQQFDKAVNLLAMGKKYNEAISVCLAHNVQLTEELAEKLTPEKDQVDEDTKTSILQTLAECLMIQGNYHLATKKFTQAGNKLQAMKALLKSGDTEKIIFFAGVSRQREIYIMAANYLQSLDWQNQPEILRNIITFYSKGKALDLLANFYVACAQIEIDEFQNYDKAYGALTEASRCLAKLQTPTAQHQKAIEIVQKRMGVIKRFIDIKRLFERGDLDGGLMQCRQFLVAGGQDLEESVRRGDVYALMVQQLVKSGNFIEAKQLVGELRQVLSASGSVPITYYLNKELIEGLARGLGVAASTFVPLVAKSGGSEDILDENEIEEEIVEE